MEKIRSLSLCYLIFMFILSAPSYAGMGGGHMSEQNKGGGMSLNHSHDSGKSTGMANSKMSRMWQRMSQNNKLQMMEQMLNDPEMNDEFINRMIEQMSTDPEVMGQMIEQMITDPELTNQMIEQMLTNSDLMNQFIEQMAIDPEFTDQTIELMMENQDIREQILNYLR